jgi:hypothetical protein
MGEVLVTMELNVEADSKTPGGIFGTLAGCCNARGYSVLNKLEFMVPSSSFGYWDKLPEELQYKSMLHMFQEVSVIQCRQVKWTQYMNRNYINGVVQKAYEKVCSKVS